MPNHTEDKSKRFERLATRRTEEILKKLKLLGNLSNKSNYTYTDQHVKEMFAAIEREVKTTRERFASRGSKADSSFRFSK
ncbi:hypothetical protein D0B54_01740 [Solimonas sp. K1W22B-7]|uniref:hypothetical protein n=1 Tax=Solimonas sp. K1W22B-7 TaxID=2303331 RepID=UPI000E332C2E|nr:hypothetical protein [Solimonas sp. K1W22B-7]AXQ27481.1 hypothetical protein D0B54_01740 [Solimonas sp. K1W22B-7]